ENTDTFSPGDQCSIRLGRLEDESVVNISHQVGDDRPRPRGAWFLFAVNKHPYGQLQPDRFSEGTQCIKQYGEPSFHINHAWAIGPAIPHRKPPPGTKGV